MTDPLKDALKAGMQALLRGDTKERDLQVERAQKIIDAKKARPSIDMSDADITAKLVHIAERLEGGTLSAETRALVEANPKAFAQFLIENGYRPTKEDFT